MQEPVWVRNEAALAIHRRQIAEHGGDEGIRDSGLLESAHARPRNRFSYADAPDLAQLAAGYAFGIAGNHPFVDGNKRVAWVVCRTFLRLNGSDLEAPAEEKFLVMLQVARGDLSEQELAAWIRARIPK